MMIGTGQRDGEAVGTHGVEGCKVGEVRRALGKDFKARQYLGISPPHPCPSEGSIGKAHKSPL